MPGDGSLAFEGVSFDYAVQGHGAARLELRRAPGGKTTALVGPTGAGKSTIQKLLLRLYDPDKGAILIDGQDIRDVRLRSARDALGVVPQDCVLFHDTIDANIRYARPEASMDEVREAARMAAFSTLSKAYPWATRPLLGIGG